MALSPRVHAALPRSTTPASIAASDSTYHSFQDLELYEPGSDKPIRVTPPPGEEDPAQSAPMHRQDSGYESNASASKSRSSRDPRSRPPTYTSHSAQLRPRTRPSIHRATQSTPSARKAHAPRRSLQQTRPRQQTTPCETQYVTFPDPDAFFGVEQGQGGVQAGHDVAEEAGYHAHPLPPQTTHYWTSDCTRKLEYAAIDAASHGVKAWFLRHVLPECFVPKESRRLCFDDDKGSVRRYRLHLDCEDHQGAEKECGGRGKKRGWLFGR